MTTIKIFFTFAILAACFGISTKEAYSFDHSPFVNYGVPVGLGVIFVFFIILTRPSTVNKKTKHFSFIKRVATKFALKAMPHNEGATGIIERELYMLQLNDSLYNIAPMNKFLVPKFLLEQFNIECENNHNPTNIFAGIKLEASKDNNFCCYFSTRLKPISN